MSTKVYKYKNELAVIDATLKKCPPASAKEQTIIAFRWVHSPIIDSDFLPQAKRNPARVLRAESFEEECSCWALSLHLSRRQSLSAYKSLAKNFRRIAIIMGDHIAEGQLTPDHGRCTEADIHGHFDLHEYSNLKVKLAFPTASAIQ